MPSRIELVSAHAHTTMFQTDVGNLKQQFETTPLNQAANSCLSLVLIDSALVEIGMANPRTKKPVLFFVPVTNFDVLTPKPL